MNRRILVPALGGAALVMALAGKPALGADAGHPTVVELFQSQGCSSCPPANANVLAIADRPDILALSWQVTYWDQLGWKDTFGAPEFTARQYDYAHAFHRNEVGTPEVVVNGRADVVGNDRPALEKLIREADRGSSGPSLRIEKGGVAVSGEGAGGMVILVRYNPNVVNVAIGRGENAGVTLPHKNVVREVHVLGSWNGGAHTFAFPTAATPGLRDAVLIQNGAGGPILAAIHD